MNKVNTNINITKKVYFVTYLEKAALDFTRSVEFDSREKAMEFVKSKIKPSNILYFTIDKQEVISAGGKTFRDSIVKGRRQYIGEVFTKERIEREERDAMSKQSILNRLDIHNVELAVKPYSSVNYEFLLPGEKVYNTDFEQVYPKVKAFDFVQQKTR
ncbi:hypothetical protein HDR59_04125 [bacterium]|nr:hypothetical protein [bacterium]